VTCLELPDHSNLGLRSQLTLASLASPHSSSQRETPCARRVNACISQAKQRVMHSGLHKAVNPNNIVTNSG
jgi:hypothetical protein